MLTPVVAYVSTAIVFLGIDALWLGRVATTYYRGWIGNMMLEQPNFAAAAVFYLVYVAGVVYFAVMPALNGGGWTQAAIAGAILGFIAYGTYDMTNLATLKNWPIIMTVVDMSWGTILTSFAAVMGFFITQKLV
ncbi:MULTISPECIES: DUF2177 family protein [Pseudorhizobium]|jgi:uncharacterized membrane protein|uniref:Membrane protein n=1 Tax=Pseudorhizobium pelagicum TaxID=1509405 RepID=A0A922P1K0_9HYPH|nr:DUF2177 family protein [Pseudorhizobium marinum]KEQ08418.1 membrane protein [Pseudorhizobium pelagicum]KEQ10687.1 membrane protein [Pseudorhizobium pelagicum]MDY6961375.1 DUF2177 family protein [Pseudomonadota bacterium]